MSIIVVGVGGVFRLVLAVHRLRPTAGQAVADGVMSKGFVIEDARVVRRPAAFPRQAAGVVELIGDMVDRAVKVDVHRDAVAGLVKVGYRQTTTGFAPRRSGWQG